jgi:hypothetical protein
MKKVIFILVVIASCFACSPRIIEKVRVEKEYIDRVQKDSVILRDSVWQKEYIKGDTVYLDKYVYKYIYRDKYQTDTVLREVHDTTQVQVPVEKKLSFVQKVKIGAFWWLLAALACALLWIFRKKIF